MPRRPTSDEATKAARWFLESFIVKTESQDHILPKNDLYSPFSGFCRVFPQFAKKKDGGSATDGVSRAAFNKICLEYFEEGMRKPARNGNPGALESGLAQQRRHFLRGRWRDIDAYAEDKGELEALMVALKPEQVQAGYKLLEDFSAWKPGPAGRGGERQNRKRGAGEEDSDTEEVAVPVKPPAKKAKVAKKQEPAQDSWGLAADALELLCEVASSAQLLSQESTEDSEQASESHHEEDEEDEEVEDEELSSSETPTNEEAEEKEASASHPAPAQREEDLERKLPPAAGFKLKTTPNLGPASVKSLCWPSPAQRASVPAICAMPVLDLNGENKTNEVADAPFASLYKSAES